MLFNINMYSRSQYHNLEYYNPLRKVHAFQSNNESKNTNIRHFNFGPTY